MDDQSSPNFLFVNSAGPSAGRDQDERTRRHIRRHVMRDVGFARRKPSRNPQFQLAFDPPARRASQLAPSGDPRAAAPARLPAGQAAQGGYPQLMRPFWERDPFIMMDEYLGMDAFAAYGFALVSNTARDSSSHEIFWFPLAFGTSEVFQRLLACPERLTNLHHEAKDQIATISLKRFTAALSCIQGFLKNQDVRTATAGNVIRAVLGVICFNYVNRDYAQAAMHLDGLHRMIAARGGIESLSADHELLLMIFWLDVTAALVSDAAPRFPIPLSLVPPLTVSKYPPPFYDIFHCGDTIGTEVDATTSAIVGSLEALLSLSTIIQSELFVRGDDLWSDEVFLGLRLNPIAHRLLSTPSATRTRTDAPKHRVLEVARLGALLFIIWIKQKSRTYPGSRATTSYWTSALDFLGDTRVEGSLLGVASLASLNLWVLVLCALTSENPAHQDKALRLIARIKVEQNVSSWEAVVERVRSMPWVGKLEASTSWMERKLEEMETQYVASRAFPSN